MFDALAHHTAHTATLLAGTGILDTANTKAAAIQVTLRAGAGVGALFFVIKNAISSGGAIARIVVAGLAAGVFMWIVFNVTDLQNRVGTEVTGAGAVAPHQVLRQPVALHTPVVLSRTGNTPALA